MEFQRVARTDPERVFIVVKNSYGTAALSAGQVAAWDCVTDRDGVAVTKPGGQTRMSVAGVAVETIAAGDYGLLQVWGYRSGVRCSGGSGLVTSKMSSGTLLHVKTSAFCFHALNSIDSVAKIPAYSLNFAGFFMAPTTAAKQTSATTWTGGKVFLKCI